jgi:hypothetical protein
VSNAVVDSQKLYAWCQAILKGIEKARSGLQRDLVEREHERYNTKRWWRPWRKPITLEQARARVENDEPFSAWGNAECFAWRTEELCRKMMAATICAERVTVSADDMDTLHHWSPKLAKSIFQAPALR